MTLGNVNSIIHHFSEIRLFTVTDEQLDALRQGGGSMWKDCFFVCLPLCIACGLNIIPNFHKVGDWWLNGNFVVSLTAGFLALFCFVAWKKGEDKVDILISKIKSQPAQVQKNIGEPIQSWGA